MWKLKSATTHYPHQNNVAKICLPELKTRIGKIMSSQQGCLHSIMVSGLVSAVGRCCIKVLGNGRQRHMDRDNGHVYIVAICCTKPQKVCSTAKLPTRVEFSHQNYKWDSTVKNSAIL